MEGDLKRTSKFLSLVLRHEPERIGLALDPNGWVQVDELLRRLDAAGRGITRALLERVVAENDKKRFSFSPDGLKIRANQGHSIEIDLALAPIAPPETLYHGTATRFLDSIREKGLIPGSRQHVHLSQDRETAVKVGQRHGNPHVLVVRAGEMHAAGTPFFQSDNGVWLTDHVPASYIIGWPEN